MKAHLTGDLGSNTSWKLYKSNTLPERLHATAVMGIVLDETKTKIFLAQNARGWDLPGGHIETGETIIDALKREISEEAGTDIQDDIVLWGYKEYQSKVPEPNRDGGFYPLLSHILYFIATSNGRIYSPHGEEITDSGIFTPQSLSIV